MMKRKFVILLILISFILCGCKDIYKMSVDEIIDKSVSRNIEVYNKYRKGYKYNLPVGLTVKDSMDYNETIFDGKYTYYLFVDAVSYYNKVIDTYETSEEPYISMPISFEDKYGYIEINELKSGKYLVEIMYNYAKIEVIVKKADINVTVANAISVLTSIKFNDNVLKKMLEEETSQFGDMEFNIFETASENSEYLQAMEENVYKDDEIHDTDLID